MSIKFSAAKGDVDVIGEHSATKRGPVPLKRGTWVDRPGRRHAQNEEAKRAVRGLPRKD